MLSVASSTRGTGRDPAFKLPVAAFALVWRRTQACGWPLWAFGLGTAGRPTGIMVPVAQWQVVGGLPVALSERIRSSVVNGGPMAVVSRKGVLSG